MLVCTACSVGFTHPRPSPSEAARLYERYRDAAAAPPAWIEAVRHGFARALAARIARTLGRGGAALEVGCGDGSALAALARHGFEGTGIDVASRPLCRSARRHGIAHREEPFEAAALDEHAWRVVLFRHVLEHLHDPVGALAKARRLVAVDGLVVIVVPNRASWQARFGRDDWHHLNLPEHLFHFTPRSLTSTLTAAGLTPVRLSHWSFDYGPYGWLQTTLNRAGGRWRTLDAHLRWSMAPRVPVDAAVLAAAAALVPLSVMASVAESLAHAGGSIEAWARPS